jgi:hypothetical protein
MERSRRGLKMQYHRVSGRKDWNAYLLRYGHSVAYAFWWEQDQQIRKSCQAFSRMDVGRTMDAQRFIALSSRWFAWHSRGGNRSLASLFHSDRGSQDTAADNRALLA